DFATRERAAGQLDKLGEAALGAYEAALAGNPSPEVRRRLESLKEKHDTWRTPSPDRLRIKRALEVLEMCGTGAHDMLETLAKGAPGAYVTEQAKGALRRMPK